ncbi:MAG TPA: adenylyltransferase/cytidyltransferase family protein [Flavitalea sp.]|nr:adenylyltransferase/cytidyltransferase family protein [Flavitalea sp.]
MKIGFACGVFDIFHAGHVMMLKKCRQHCDYLIVAVNKGENISDKINPGKRKPVFSLEERKMVLQNSKYVDEVLEYDSEEGLYQLLKARNINIRFLGEDYKGKMITGEDLKIPVYYIDRSHGYSTTTAIERILNIFNSEQ